MNQSCPCHSGRIFEECCQIYCSRIQMPSTPEALMRSRYTAFVLKDWSYIKSTSMGKALKQFKRSKSLESVEWLGLEVIKTRQKNAVEGWVEFIAYYQLNDKEYTLHERSYFKYHIDCWYYTHGRQLP